MNKTCTVCGIAKPIDAFHKDSNKPSGHVARCKKCRAQGHIPRTNTSTPVEVSRPVEESIPPVVEHRLKQQNARLERQLKQALDQLHNATAMNDLRVQTQEQAEHARGIEVHERKQGAKREATALVCASDWHIEECVRPEQVAGRNRYNLEISEKRMQRFFQATRYAINFNRQIFTIRDCVLWLGGDLITNYLHEDNIESNELPPVKAIAYAYQSLCNGIRYLLEDPELERLVIPCNDGNHGRLTKRMHSSTRTDNSIEWLLYTMLADAFKDEPRVNFKIATGEQLYLNVYGRSIRFLHGDVVNYHGGVGGITIPLLRAMGRWESVRHADLTVLGHFHQLLSLPDLIVNGSLIGYSPYAMTIGARFEPPAQAFTILDSVRFKSISMPLWVSSRNDDEQNKDAA